MAKHKGKKNQFLNKVADEALAIREADMKEVYRRKDGVLQLPTRNYYGFAFDLKLILAT